MKYIKQIIIAVLAVMPVLKGTAQAPPLAVSEWLNGTPANLDHRPYVIEFASTSCPPCRKSIPHLAELTRKYKGQITVISIFSNDTSVPTDHRYVTRVKSLFTNTQPQMPFHVGIDSGGRASMNRFQVTSWPTIVMIDPTKGIIWRGHNILEVDAVVKKVVDKTFNPHEAQQRQKIFSQRITRVSNLQLNGKYEAALSAIDSLLKEYPEQQGVLVTTKFKLLIGRNDQQAYQLVRDALHSGANVIWEKIIDPAWTATPNPDYAAVMLLFNRALAEAPTDRVKVALLLRKAHVLRHRALNRPDSSEFFLNAARQLLNEVAEYTLEAEERAQWSQKHVEYDYLCTVAQGDSNLNQLTSIREADKKNTAWMSVTDAVLKLNNKKACAQLIPWISAVWTDAREKKIDRLVLWSGERLVKLYQAIGDQQFSVKTCRESVIYFQRAGNESKADTFEKLLESIN